MTSLDLSANQISRRIPNWIWKIGSLMQLNLSHNLLVDLEKPYKFPSLSVLDLYSNKLHGEIPIPPESVTYVDYSSNNFNFSIPVKIGNKLTFAYFFSLSSNCLIGTIPESICNIRFLNVLDLSNNNFSGTIPLCLIENSTKTLGVLNLRNNNLGGKILGTFLKSYALETLDISRNHLEGQVPKSLANYRVLEVLNVGNKEINDSFSCFLGNLSSLRVLVFRSNKFHGGIRICRLGHYMWLKLQIIDLASNNFSGDLPDKVFTHWKAMTVAGHNAKSNFNQLWFKFLKHNGFYYQDTVTLNNKGMEMELVKILTIFTSIDISNNNFQGVIPNTVGFLKSLYVLNTSHNALTGSIPSSIGNLTQLGSLDLSHNKLSGSIPVQLASLTFLAFLNLSYNQLVRMIPKGSQIQTFSDTSFQGNKGLWLGFEIGAGVIIGPLMFWKQGSKWCNKHIERFAQMILPSLGFIFAWCDYVKVEPNGNIEEETQDDKEDLMKMKTREKIKHFSGNISKNDFLLKSIPVIKRLSRTEKGKGSAIESDSNHDNSQYSLQDDIVSFLDPFEIALINDTLDDDFHFDWEKVELTFQNRDFAVMDEDIGMNGSAFSKFPPRFPSDFPIKCGIGVDSSKGGPSGSTRPYEHNGSGVGRGTSGATLKKPLKRKKKVILGRTVLFIDRSLRHNLNDGGTFGFLHCQSLSIVQMQTNESPLSDVPVDMVEDPNVAVQPNEHHLSFLEPQSQQVNDISLSEQSKTARSDLGAS
ncbi:hypothetical protein TEA_001520 [Camellia sinensis var. sinensis]|uniref:Uncharacterized protein n=1 Tax=Camellia sinensis var. sinensis TaxID=542762 RepID=A0A4S4E8D3_CAMSN|nr:hypothetical protein TEA_001520 [Camellia sinensis var. sinensis]